jgi:hypothetical protein
MSYFKICADFDPEPGRSIAAALSLLTGPGRSSASPSGLPCTYSFSEKQIRLYQGDPAQHFEEGRDTTWSRLDPPQPYSPA